MIDGQLLSHTELNLLDEHHCDFLAHTQIWTSFTQSAMSSRQLYPVFLWFLFSQQKTTAQPINIRTLQSNDCEQTTSGGRTVYYACLGEPIHLLRSGNSNFNLTVEPGDSTCGSPRETFCTLVRGHIPPNGVVRH